MTSPNWPYWYVFSHCFFFPAYFGFVGFCFLKFFVSAKEENRRWGNGRRKANTAGVLGVWWVNAYFL